MVGYMPGVKPLVTSFIYREIRGWNDEEEKSLIIIIQPPPWDHLGPEGTGDTPTNTYKSLLGIIWNAGSHRNQMTTVDTHTYLFRIYLFVL
jgi:hypothetical protein